MNKILLGYGLVAIFLIIATVSGDSATDQWEKNYGGSFSQNARSVQQTSDGGYIVLGVIFRDTRDGYLLKTDSKGIKQWDKIFGSSLTDYFDYDSVQQTSDGGYIVAGCIDTIGNDNQAYLLKTNDKGKTQWEKNYGGLGDERGTSVQQTSDGGYIIAGSSLTVLANHTYLVPAFLLKIDDGGIKKWEKTFTGLGYAGASSVKQTSEGGYIVAGYTKSLGYLEHDQAYLLKTNDKGEKQWEKNYFRVGNTYAKSVQQTSDGGYIIAGYTHIGTDEMQVYLLKTNEKGEKQWEQNYGGVGDTDGCSVQQTVEGGYIIAGSTGPSNKRQVHIIKTDDRGVILWEKTFKGLSFAQGYSVRQTSDTGFIVAGETTPYTTIDSKMRVYLMKLGPSYYALPSFANMIGSIDFHPSPSLFMPNLINMS